MFRALSRIARWPVTAPLSEISGAKFEFQLDEHR